MYANKPHPGISPRTRVLMIAVLAGALFTMGAKWVERPIQNFDGVAGEWRGSGSTASGAEFGLKFIIKADGSYRVMANWMSGSNDYTGPLRLKDGKIEFKSPTNGETVTLTLSEDKKGKRKLKARRPDGMTWSVKPAKK